MTASPNDLKAAVERVKEDLRCGSMIRDTAADVAMILAHLSPPEPIPEGEIFDQDGDGPQQLVEQAIAALNYGYGNVSSVTADKVRNKIVPGLRRFLANAAAVRKPLPAEPAPVDGEYSSVAIASPTVARSSEARQQDAEMDAEVCGFVREAANRVTGGNCAFVDDDIRILEHLATRAVRAGLTDEMSPAMALKASQALVQRDGEVQRSGTTEPNPPAAVDEGERELEAIAVALAPGNIYSMQRVGDFYNWVERLQARIRALKPLLAKLKAGEEEIARLKQFAMGKSTIACQAAEARSEALAAEVGRLHKIINDLIDESPALIVKAVRSPSDADALGEWTSAIKAAREARALTDGGGE